jgi:hypothetical protein
MDPSAGTEQFGDPLTVVVPDCEVKIGVRARNSASVKVDRPAAE